MPFEFGQNEAAYGAVVSNVLGRLNSQSRSENPFAETAAGRQEIMADHSRPNNDKNPNEIDDVSMSSITYTSQTTAGTGAIANEIGHLAGGKRNNKSTSKSLQAKWDQMFLRLLEFKKKNGHCLVPNRYAEDRSLGAWVSTQRRQYKVLTSGNNKSTPITLERARKLNDIGFVWSTTDPRHTPWEKRYQQLCEFYEKYGHSLVPIGFEDNVQLANWVSTQRQEYKSFCDGKPARITEERIKLLNKLGFVWDAQRGNMRMAPQYREKMKNLRGEDDGEKVDKRKKIPNDDEAVVPMDSIQTPSKHKTAYNGACGPAGLLPASITNLAPKRMKTDTGLDTSSMAASLSPTSSHRSSLSLHAQALFQTQFLGASLSHQTALANAAALVSAARNGPLHRHALTSSVGHLGSSLGSFGAGNGVGTSGMGAAPLGLAGAAGLAQTNLLANRIQQARQSSLHGDVNPTNVASSDLSGQPSSLSEQFGKDSNLDRSNKATRQN